MCVFFFVFAVSKKDIDKPICTISPHLLIDIIKCTSCPDNIELFGLGNVYVFNVLFRFVMVCVRDKTSSHFCVQIWAQRSPQPHPVKAYDTNLYN